MRIAFAGSGAFGIPALRALATAGPRPLLVIAQPDQPAGRRRELTPAPLAAAAAELGFEVFKPERINTIAARERLQALDLDLLIVVAYGQILKPKLLALPRLGCMNIHGSLLPRHRGASPVQAAILAGDAQSGVTIMALDEGLDSGPVYAAKSTPIGSHETAGELHDRLAEFGAGLLLEVLAECSAGRARAMPQDHAQATHCGLITKADGRIDWRRPAVELQRHVRGMTPWPSAWTTWTFAGGTERLVIQRSDVVPAHGSQDMVPGTVVEASTRLLIATGEGFLAPLVVQRAGKRALPVQEFLRGQAPRTGDQLGAEDDEPAAPIA